MLAGKCILLIVSGGIAAYKSPEIVRLLRARGCTVKCILTRGGAKFITPLTLAALSGEKVHESLFSLTDESEMGHIRLASEADLMVVAPATANIMAKMAAGIADDLATTVLLASKQPVMVAPAMNVHMWEHQATRANLMVLESRGALRIGPEQGSLACHDHGMGRMAEPQAIVNAIEQVFESGQRLAGRQALVTSGPTHEAIDPVRYIANRSSGKQGHAIAGALARMGAKTTLVCGPTNLPDPAGVSVVRVETARQMLAACESALPVDVAVCAAAVADWRPVHAATTKIKKAGQAQKLELIENPDILARLSAAGERRPRLVVGFAAETGQVIDNARAKLAAKGCDWIVANDVSSPQGAFASDDNAVHLVMNDGALESWPIQPKTAVAKQLAERIALVLEHS